MNQPARTDPAGARRLPSSPAPAPRPMTTPLVWDEVRVGFHGSLLCEASLANLAQNIDGCVWESSETPDTPAAYIDLSYDEALASLRSRGLPPSRLDDLVAILRGTLAFDDSFGAMVEIAAKSEARSDIVARNLQRLGIPKDFPISLCALSPGTLDFCVREKIATLWEFLLFARSASRQVIIGGEFRELLNAVVQIDGDTLSTLLPFRRKASGLYLIESIGLLLSRLGVEERMLIARAPASAPLELRAEIARRCDYFSEQVAHLRTQLHQGAPLSRLVVSLDDLSSEAAVSSLLDLYLNPPALPAFAPTPRRRRRLLDWFR